MRERGVTFTELADRLGRPKVWVAAAVLGQHPFSADEAAQLVSTLELDDEAAIALQQIPTRGGDGIMSAINFRADIERISHPAGDRVRVTLDGKFLPYQFDDI
jgi:cyanate lyase